MELYELILGRMKARAHYDSYFSWHYGLLNHQEQFQPVPDKSFNSELNISMYLDEWRWKIRTFQNVNGTFINKETSTTHQNKQNKLTHATIHRHVHKDLGKELKRTIQFFY